MAISLVAGSALSNGSSNGGAVTHTFPAGVLQNDVVLVFAACATSITMSTAGYTQLSTTSTTNNVATVWMKAMGATPDTSVTVTGSGNALHRTQSSMFILRGADPGTIDVSASATGSSTNPNPPSVTTRFANDWVVVFASSAVNDIAITAPTNYVNLTVAGGTDASTGGLSMTGAGATRLVAAAGVEDPAAFGSWNTGAWCAFSIGVREWQQNLYWVGGTATWDNSNSTNWSATSGGAGGGGIPGPRTNVFFNASSGSGSWSVTVGSGAACEDISFSSLVGTMTLAGSSALIIGGDVTMTTTNFVNSYTGAITFECPGSATINTGGVTLASNLTWDTADAQSPTYTLGANLTTTGTSTFNLGTLALSSFTYTTATFSSNNSNTRTLNFGTGKIVVTSSSAVTVWETSTVTGLTVSGTPLVETTGGGSTTKTINTGTLSEANSISFSILNSAGTVTFGLLTNVVRNLTVNASGATLSQNAITIYGNYTYTAGTVAGGGSTWTFAATSGTKTIDAGGSGIFYSFPVTFNGAGGTWQLTNTDFYISGAVTLTSGTLALSSRTLYIIGNFSSNNSNTRSITASTGKIILQNVSTGTVFDTGTVTGLTTSGNPLVELIGSSAITRTINSGALGAASAFKFSILTTGGTVTFTASNTVDDLIINASGTTISNIAITIYGGYTYTDGTLTAGANAWTFASTTSQTITDASVGTTHDFPITFNGVGGTWTLGSSFTIGASRTTTLTAGTLALSTFLWSTGTFSSNNSNTRSVTSGTGGTISVNITTAATVWDTGTVTGLTTSGNPSIEVNGSTAVTRTINTGALNAANSFNMFIATTAGTITFTAGNTVRNLSLFAGGTTISNIAITIHGDYLYAGGTLTAGGNAWTFATTSSQTIGTAGTTHDFPFTYAGTGTYNVSGNINNSARLVTLTSGTLSLSTFTITCGQFNSSNANTRTMAFGTGKIVVNSTASVTSWDTGTITNLTVTGSRTVELTGATAAITRTINSGQLGESSAFNFSILTTSSTVTFTANNSVNNLTINGAGTTITNIALTIYGNYNYTAGTLGAGANAWTFAATSGTKTVFTGGTLHDFSFTFNGTGGTFQLTSALNFGSTRNLIVNAGTLDPNNLAIAGGNFGMAGGVLGTNISTMTITAVSYTGGTYNTNGTHSYASFTQNGAATSIDLTNTTDFNVSGTYTLTAGALALSSKTLDVGQFSSNNANTRSIGFGTGKISVNSTTTSTVWDTGTITGLTITGTPIVDIIGGSAVTRTINSGTLAEASSINFNLLSSAGTITFTASNTTRDLTINASGTTISNIAITIYGDYTYTAGTLSAGANTWTFAGTDTETITTGGTLHDFPFTFNGTGTYTLGSNLVSGSTRTTTLSTGTLALGTFNLTTGLFSSGTVNTRSVTASTGKIVLNYSTAAGATIFNIALTTGLTTTGNPVIEIANTAAQICTINSGTLGAANAFSFLITATTGTTTFTGANTMWDLTINGAGNTISNASIIIYGSYSYSAGTLTAGTNAWTFSATTSETISGSGTTHDFPITFNGSGGNWTLGSNFTVGATRLTTLTTGTLSIGSFTWSTGQFSSSGAGVRGVSATSGTIGITFATAATVFDTTTVTNMTNVGNPTVTLGGSAAVVRTISAGALSEANAFSFNITATAGTTEFTNGNTVKNLTISGAGHVVSNRTLTIYGNYTYTAGTIAAGANTWTFGTTLSNTINSTTTQEFPITFNGSGGTWTLQNNFTVGSANTTTLTAGTVSLNNLVLSTGIFNADGTTARTIAFGSTGNIAITGSGTTVWNAPTLTNLSTTGLENVNLVYAGSVGTRTINHGATAGGSESSALSVNVKAGSDTVTFTGSSSIGNLNFTGFTGSWSNSAFNIYGNLTISSGMTVGSGTGAVTFASSLVTQTITDAGKTLDFPITKSGTATLQLTSNLDMGTTSTSVFTLNQGTLDANNNWLKAWGFNSNNSNTRTLAFGNNPIELFGNNGTVLNISTATGLTATGSRLFKATYAGATGTRTFTLPLLNAGGTEANAMDLWVNGGTDTLTVGGASAAAATVIRNLDFTGFGGTWSQTSTGSRKIYGNLRLWPTMTISSSTLITEFSATTGTQIITSSGKTMDFPITLNGTGNYLVYDPMAIGSTRTLTLTTGNLDLNYNTVNVGTFSSSGTSARRIDFDGGAIVINGSATTVLNIADATNYSHTGVSNIWLNSTTITGTRTLNFGGTAGDTEANSPNVTVVSGGDALSISTGASFNNFYAIGFGGSLQWLTWNLYGDIKVPASATIATGTGVLTFSSTSGTKKVDFSNLTVDHPITFNGVGGTWDLSSNLIMGSTRTLTLTAGNINMNSYAISSGIAIISGATSRSIDFGAQGQIYITGSGATVWNAGTLTGIAISGDPRVNFNYTGAVGTRIITHGTTGGSESTAITANVTDGTDIVEVNGHFRDINYYSTTFAGTVTQTATLNVYGNLSFSSTQISNSGTQLLNLIPSSGDKTITSNGATIDRPVTFNGTAAWNLQDNMTVGSTRVTTLTAGNLSLGSSTLTVGNLASNGSSVRSIDFGTGKMAVTGVTNTVVGFATATNFTASGTKNVELATASTTGTRTINFGGTAGATEDNSLNFNVQAGSDTIAVNGATGNLVFWGFTGSWTPSAISVYGNLLINPSQTLGTSTSAVTIAATSGNKTIDTGNKTIDFPLIFNAPGSSYYLQSALTMGSTATSTLSFTAGTVNMGANQISVPTAISASGSSAKALVSNAAVILSGSGTVWSAAAATNITMSGDGYFVLSSASAKTFAGGTSNGYFGLIQAGAGLLTITGSSSFQNIANSALPAPVRFEAGSTNTFTQGFNLRGAGGTRLVIDSTVPGTAATLSLSSGTVRGQDLDLKDSTATGGAAWYAGQTSIDSGNVTGWIFDGVPVNIGRGISVGRGITIS